MMDTTALNTLRAARAVLEAHGFDSADVAACIAAAGQANEDGRLADLPDGWTLCPRCNERTCVVLDGVCFYCHRAELARRAQLRGVREGRFDHLPNGCTCSVEWLTFAPGGLSGICGACGQRWEIDNGRVARRVETPRIGPVDLAGNDDSGRRLLDHLIDRIRDMGRVLVAEDGTNDQEHDAAYAVFETAAPFLNDECSCDGRDARASGAVCPECDS